VKRVPAAFALAAALVCGFARAQAPEESVVVVGRLEGPRLWSITQGEAEVWILGATEYLPKGIDWDARRVEAVLKRADGVITEPRAQIGLVQALNLVVFDRGIFQNPHKAKLRDVLPGDLYARFAAARARLGKGGDDYERWRPFIAGLMMLDKAADKAHLDRSRRPEERVRRLARARGVPVRPVYEFKARPLIDEIRAVSPQADRACLEAALTVIESDMPRLRDIAAAWAKGDVARLRALPPPPEIKRCTDGVVDDAPAFRAAQAQTKARWLAAAKAALTKPAVTLIVAPMDEALGADGLIAALRREGYAVDGP
jgi:uncharacterized protein YbaP (TraB family)